MSGYYHGPSEYGDPPLTEQEVNASKAAALGLDSPQSAALQLHNVEQREDEEEEQQQQMILRPNRLNSTGFVLYHHQADHYVQNNFFIQNQHLIPHLGASPADVHAAALQADQERARHLHSADHPSDMMDIDCHSQTAPCDPALFNDGDLSFTAPTGFHTYDPNQPGSHAHNDFGQNSFAGPYHSHGGDYDQVAPPDPNSIYAGVFGPMAPPDPYYAHASAYGQAVAARPIVNATHYGSQYLAAPEGRNPFTVGPNGQTASSFPLVSDGHVLRPEFRTAPATGRLAQPMNLGDPNDDDAPAYKQAAPRKPTTAAAKETTKSGNKSRDPWTKSELEELAHIEKPKDIDEEYIQDLGAHTVKSAKDKYWGLGRDRRGTLSVAAQAAKARRLLREAAMKPKKDKANKKIQKKK